MMKAITSLLLFAFVVFSCLGAGLSIPNCEEQDYDCSDEYEPVCCKTSQGITTASNSCYCEVACGEVVTGGCEL